MAETAPGQWTDSLFGLHGCDGFSNRSRQEFRLTSGALTSAERPAVLSGWVWLPRRPRHSPASHKASAETFRELTNKEVVKARARGHAATVEPESDLLSLDNDGGAAG